MSELGSLDQTLNDIVSMLKTIIYMIYVQINLKSLFIWIFKQKFAENVMQFPEYLNAGGVFTVT